MRDTLEDGFLPALWAFILLCGSAAIINQLGFDKFIVAMGFFIGGILSFLVMCYSMGKVIQLWKSGPKSHGLKKARVVSLKS